MTLATYITVLRIFLVPVFAYFAIRYGHSIRAASPDENLRYIALAIFTIAAVSDGIDGYIARHFHQESDLGAFLDPIADKLLITTALIILTLLPWGHGNWSVPLWFTTLVIVRDSLILIGIRFLYSAKKSVSIRPHWSSKLTTFAIFLVIAWTMLKVIPVSPIYPCVFAAILILVSAVAYYRRARRIFYSPA